MFFEGKVIRVLVHFFFTATSLTHFHPALVATSISPFVTTTTKFSCCYSNKKMSPFFYLSLQISAAFFLVERRWPAAYFVFFSGCFSLLLYSKFVDLTINLSLIFQTTRIQKQFLLSIFVFLDSLVVSALKNTGGQVISRFSFGLLYLLIELFYIGMPVMWTDSCLVGVRSSDYQIFWDIQSFLPVVLCCVCESSSLRWVLCYVGLWDSDGLFGGFKSFQLWGNWNGVQFSKVV